MMHTFIVGSKGIPARYGGFETFAERLTRGKISGKIKYHVSCMNNAPGTFLHNGAECFNVRLPLPGAPGRILHMGLVLQAIEAWMKKNPDEKVIVLILGCRVGPFLIPHAKKLHQLGAKIICNPDGIEWKRDKWNAAAKRFLKYCESCLVRYSDMAVCDSPAIEAYVKETYPGKKTVYIAYGADTTRSACGGDALEKWLSLPHVRAQKGGYYLIVGRFVPENNYETMIREFMKSRTEKALLIISNVEKNRFYEKLLKTTGFADDPRIRFAGTVYDAELLKKIRECAYGYIHGHEVGGTNPSLLEAMASTGVNLLYDCIYNKDVGEDAALYWNKEPGNLSALIGRCDRMDDAEIRTLDEKSTQRIAEQYSWESICMKYENVFFSAYGEEE